MLVKLFSELNLILIPGFQPSMLANLAPGLRKTSFQQAITPMQTIEVEDTELAFERPQIFAPALFHF